jgi:hypothetical protein
MKKIFEIPKTTRHFTDSQNQNADSDVKLGKISKGGGGGNFNKRIEF